MASIPWWAIAAGAPKILDEFVVDPIKSGYGLYTTIRDDQRRKQDEAAASEVLSDYAMASGPEDVRFIQQTAPRYGVKDPNSLVTLQDRGDKLIDRYRKDESDNALPGALSEFSQIALNNPNQPIGTAFLRMTPENQAVLAGTLKGGLDDFAKAMSYGGADAARAAEARAKSENMSNFQSAIAGITGPSTSPNDLKRFTGRMGYAPITDVESDIRQAAAAYNVGDSDEVNKAITGARELYKSTYLPQETVKTGNTTATGQRNLMGDFRKDVQDKAPSIRVSVGDGIRNDRLTQSWYDRYQKHPIVKASQEGLSYADGMESTLKEMEAGRLKNLTAADETFVRGMLRGLESDSVVMISEGKSLESNAPILNKARGAMTRVLRGGKMFTDDERKAIVQTLRIYRGAINRAKTKVKAQFEKNMPRNVDRGTVFMGDVDDMQFTADTPPAPGKLGSEKTAPTVIRYDSKGRRIQ